ARRLISEVVSPCCFSASSSRIVRARSTETTAARPGEISLAPVLRSPGACCFVVERAIPCSPQHLSSAGCHLLFSLAHALLVYCAFSLCLSIVRCTVAKSLFTIRNRPLRHYREYDRRMPS